MKRNGLWKKVVGGIMAFGMVLTLLPAGGMTAKAAQQTVDVYLASLPAGVDSVSVGNNTLSVKGAQGATAVTLTYDDTNINDENAELTVALKNTHYGYLENWGRPVVKVDSTEIGWNSNDNAFIIPEGLMTGKSELLVTVSNVGEKRTVTYKSADQTPAIGDIAVNAYSTASPSTIMHTNSIEQSWTDYAVEGSNYRFVIGPHGNYAFESVKWEVGSEEGSAQTDQDGNYVGIIPGDKITGPVTITVKAAAGETVHFEYESGASVRYNSEEKPLSYAGGLTLRNVPANKDFTFTIVPPSGKTLKSVSYDEYVQVTSQSGSFWTEKRDTTTNEVVRKEKPASNNSVTIPKDDLHGSLNIKLNYATTNATVSTSGNLVASESGTIASGKYYLKGKPSGQNTEIVVPASGTLTYAIETGSDFEFKLYDNSKKAASGKTVLYEMTGKSGTQSATTKSDGSFKIEKATGNITFSRVVTDIPVVVAGTSSYNIKASRTPGSGNYYASTSSSSTTTTSRVLITDNTSSTVMTAPGKAFSFYLYDNNGQAAPGRTVTYRFSGGSDLTLNSDSNGYCTTATVPVDATQITLYSVETGTVNATYAGNNASDNLANVSWQRTNGTTTRLTTSATAVPRSTAFTFSVSPIESSNGIRVNPQVAVTVGNRSVSPEVVSRGINGITYRIAAASVTGDIVISKYTSIGPKQTIHFDEIPNLTVAQRNDGLGDMQPYNASTRSMTLVRGDNAVIRLTPASGYTLSDTRLRAKATSSSDETTLAGVTRNGTSGLTSIPASEITSGMRITDVSTIAAAPSGTSQTTGFVDDANISSWAKQDIKTLADLNLVKGDQNNRFNPTLPATRADFATMLFRIRGVRAAATVSRFPDVTPAIGADYFEAILASENDNPAVINGFPDGNFYPSRNVTRGQAILMAYRAAGSPAFSGGSYFRDLEPWYATAANWGAASGIVNGVGNGEYAGARNITREEMCAILVRAMRRNVFPRMNVMLP